MARMQAAGAAKNCPALLAAANQRIALLQRAASLRSGVVNCEDATHKNSDRDTPGFDAREIALTRNAVASMCSAANAVQPEKHSSGRQSNPLADSCLVVAQSEPVSFSGGYKTRVTKASDCR